VSGRNQARKAIVPVDRAAEQLEIAHNNQQQVVKVMGDAASKLADRLHLLSLPQCILGLAAFPDLSLDALLECFVYLSQSILGSSTIERQTNQICDCLEEVDVVLSEGAGRVAVDLKHAKRMVVGEQNDVESAADPMLQKQFGRFEAVLIL
jgi:hypothetical protein